MKEIKINVDTHRLSLLFAKIKDATAIIDSVLQRKVQIFQRVETKRLAFRKITPLIKGDSPGTLGRIIITDNNDKREITEGDELPSKLIIRNTNHFGQAKETPFTKPPLSNIVLLLEAKEYFSKNIFSGDLSEFQQQDK